jgi:hypothetical protein
MQHSMIPVLRGAAKTYLCVACARRLVVVDGTEGPAPAAAAAAPASGDP